MHIIHDVPLAELGARLTASGVEPDMKDRALAKIREAREEQASAEARPAPPAPSTPAAPPETPAASELGKYRRMLKMRASGGAQGSGARRLKTCHFKPLDEAVKVEDTVWAEDAATDLVGLDDLALLEEIFATKAAAPLAKKTARKAARAGPSGSLDGDDDDDTVKKVSLVEDSRRRLRMKGLGGETLLEFFANALEKKGEAHKLDYADKCCERAGTAIVGLDADLSRLRASTRRCLAYFGEDEGGRPHARLRGGSVPSEVRKARDKVKFKREARDRANRKREQDARDKADKADKARPPAASADRRQPDAAR
ncbi:hypothetical protein JL720_15197 [Aureococcus anophagefferens]|nr:hypothetical protein JL720_15197 [Aureococcus anophagefferens]